MQAPANPRVPGTAEVERVFRASSGQVWRAILAATAGRADIADEVTAEAFARALANADSIREPLPWVYRTAFRLAFAELRRERAVADLDHPRIAATGATGSQALSPQLATLLGALSPQQRAAVFLHYHADLPVSEVARLMGTSAATVKVHLHRGRRRLRGLLETEEARDG